jgi:chromosome segregation ATPase
MDHLSPSVPMGIAIVSLIATVVQSILGYLDKRDARQLDVKVALLHDQNSDLQITLAKCEEQHEKSHADREKLWESLRNAEQRADDAANKAEIAERKIHELELKVQKV